MADSGYVQKATKRVHYTITPIGGDKELKQYRLLKEAEEDAHEKRMAPIRQAAIDRVKKHVAEQDLVLTLNNAEKIEMELLQAKHNKNCLTHVNPKDYSPWTPGYTNPWNEYEREEEDLRPRKSLLNHFKTFCINMWCNAFRSER